MERLKSKFKNIFYCIKLTSIGSDDAVVFFRRAIAIITSLSLLSYWKDFSYLFGSSTILPKDFQTVLSPNWIISYQKLFRRLELLFPSTSYIDYIFLLFIIILCILLFFGIFTRLSALFLLITHCMFLKDGVYFNYGFDYFLLISYTYLFIWGSVTKYLIFEKVDISSNDFLVFTMKIHLCIAYFSSGLEKVLGYNWRNGESVWKAVHLPTFNNDFGIHWNSFGEYPILFLITGWITILIELLYPIFVNFSKTRGIFLIFVIALHLGIVVFLNLYFFSAIMIIWNLTAYYFSKNSIVPKFSASI
jgi:hypothetical protein